MVWGTLAGGSPVPPGTPNLRRQRDFVLIFQPGICNSRNEPIPVLQRKDFLHYLREADTGFKKKRLPHTAYAIRCTAARAQLFSVERIVKSAVKTSAPQSRT